MESLQFRLNFYSTYVLRLVVNIDDADIHYWVIYRYWTLWKFYFYNSINECSKVT